MSERHCGSCTLCCKLLPVRELAKPADTKCRHQSSKGCAIYRRPGFPASCDLWSCRWLVVDDTADMLRPDRVGYVLDLVPDLMRLNDTATGMEQEIEVVQVWVAPGVDPLNDKRLRRYAERQAERGAALLLRWGHGPATAVFPPALSRDGEWHVIDSADPRMQKVETQSGSRLLDRLKATETGT
jgi:hypothetical protein